MIAKHKTSMLAAAWFLCQALEPARAADGLAWEAGEGYRRAKLKVPQEFAGPISSPSSASCSARI